MILKLVRPLRFVARAVTAESTPRRVALGFAIGAIIGFVPKDNLIVLALITLLFAIRVNILAGIIAAATFSFIGLAITPFLDHMGSSLLAISPLQNLFARMYDMPLGAWTRFNNTVVAGGLLVGLLQFYPIYFLTKVFVANRLSEWSAACRETELGRALLGGDSFTTIGAGRIG